jgi:hypothetical protein
MSFTVQNLNGRIVFLLGNSEIIDITTVEDFEKVLNSSSDSLENLIDLIESSSRESLEEELSVLKSGGSTNPGSKLVAYTSLIQSCSRFIAQVEAKRQEEEARIELLNEINSPEFQ